MGERLVWTLRPREYSFALVCCLKLNFPRGAGPALNNGELYRILGEQEHDAVPPVIVAFNPCL